MVLDIEIEWMGPYYLKDGRRNGLIYDLDEFGDLPDSPGVYCFGREFGDSFIPLYIGQAGVLQNRIGQQLNNVRLMRGLQDAPKGYRALLIGRTYLKPGQQMARVLDVVESALIEYALTNGHELLNRQGTRFPVHSIESRGSRKSRAIAPPEMFVRSRG